MLKFIRWIRGESLVNLNHRTAESKFLPCVTSIYVYTIQGYPVLDDSFTEHS